jgi:hypothetical protein
MLVSHILIGTDLSATLSIGTLSYDSTALPSIQAGLSAVQNIGFYPSPSFFPNLMSVLREKFPRIDFTSNIAEDGQLVVSVHDIDFYFSEEFKTFLNKLEERLELEDYAVLDFVPAERIITAMNGLSFPSIANIFIYPPAQGVTSYAQTATIVDRSLNAGCEYVPFDEYPKVA